MIYILAYLLIGFCTYMLMKNWLYKLTAPIGGFYSGIQELFSAMDEQDVKNGKAPEDGWKIVPENRLVAIVLTLLMIWCCISWPVTLLWMAWQQINGRTWEELIYESE